MRGKNRGFITAFVALIMVPVVAITGTMVDVARLKLYSSQAVMAADSYGEAVLSEYDNTLKELYGLFSVTQNEEGLAAIEELAKCTGYSFNPNGDGELNAEGFMPYKDAVVNIKHEKLPESSLSNTVVMSAQISDFMKFRVVEEVMDESGILALIAGFECMNSDMEAVEMRTEITKSSSDALSKINDYYDVLKTIHDYDDYQKAQKELYDAYADKIKEVYNSETYKKYAYYLDNKKEIDDAKDAVDAAKAAQDAIDAAKAAGQSTEGMTVPEVTDEEKKMAARHIDASAYKTAISNNFTNYSNVATKNNTKYGIKFGDVEKQLKELESIQGKLQTTLDTLQEQINNLKEQMKTCSPEMYDGLNAELADLKEVAESAPEYAATVKLLKDNNIAGKDKNNKTKWDAQVKVLDELKKDLIAGDIIPDYSDDGWSKFEGSWAALTEAELNPITFEWYHFYPDKKDFYDDLDAMCNKDAAGNVTGNKKQADDDIKHAEDEAAKMKEKISGDEKTDARDITDKLDSQLFYEPNGGGVPNIMDVFTGGASVADLGEAGMQKFLVTTYNFGMFSSRVSGLEKPEPELPIGGSTPGGDSTPGTGTTTPSTGVNLNKDNNTGSTGGGTSTDPTPTTGSTGEYFDESLTKVKMCRENNYLYGAEIEYLIGGNNKSKDNLNETRNVICTIRMTTNFVSTYTIPQINSAINSIAAAAEAAVVATGVGAAAGPLIRAAVSGALRLGVATFETVCDWELLTQRKEVIFYKSSVDDLTSIELLGSLLGGSFDKNKPDSDCKVNTDKKLTDTGTSGKTNAGLELKLSYEDYLYIMMLLFVDADTLLTRTGDLITLNVNLHNLGVNKDDKLETLTFLMQNTTTAVRSKCEVDLDFVIVPEYMMNLFVTDDTTAIIQKQNDGSYGYSVIRGY